MLSTCFQLGMSLLGGHRYFKLRHYLTGVDPSVYRAQIVSNVSLRLESGSMLAIMGPTGSGKTTLLNVLAGGKPRSSLQVRH